MRVSRNRYWGHPELIKFIEQLAGKGMTTGWHGLLIGDMSQPRGGPLLAGHASHQVGLDVDIWFTPMPSRELTRQQREEMMATMVVATDRKDVAPKVWSPAHIALIKAAAEDPRVNRVFVNPAIKKALCRDVGDDRACWARFSRGSDMIGTFMSVSIASPIARTASRSRHAPRATAATPKRWSVGPTTSCWSIRTPHAGPQMSKLPKACWDVLNAP